MTDNQNQAPEDIGAPQSYLVLKPGTSVYDRSGDHVGEGRARADGRGGRTSSTA